MDTIDKSIQFLTDLLLDDPGNTRVRLQLASAFMQKNQKEKAKKQFLLVLEQDSDNETAKKALEELESDLMLKSSASNEGSNTVESKKEIKISQSSGNSDVVDLTGWFEKAQTTFADVGGMEEIKEEIRLSIIYPFQKPELYEKYKKKIGGGFLLYGPPGCGKTHIARATAGEIKARFLVISLEDILDMWFGESEKKLHALFNMARDMAPTVIFVDEVDALGIDRLKVAGSAGRTLVNQFLTEMDGISSNNDTLLVLGATNVPWQIDPALRRPGRFDKVLFVPPPDELARAEIFKIHLGGKPVDDAVDLLDLARKTRGFSGADIAKVCDMAAEAVMREVLKGAHERNIHKNDFFKAISQTHNSTNEWFASAKNFARYANESGVYSPILDYMRKEKID